MSNNTIRGLMESIAEGRVSDVLVLLDVLEESNDFRLVLARYGWTVGSLSPLEIRNMETGEFASGSAARLVIADVYRRNENMEDDE